MCNGLIIQKESIESGIYQRQTQIILATLEKKSCIRNRSLEQLNEFITELMSSKFSELFPAGKI